MLIEEDEKSGAHQIINQPPPTTLYSHSLTTNKQSTSFNSTFFDFYLSALTIMQLLRLFVLSALLIPTTVVDVGRQSTTAATPEEVELAIRIRQEKRRQAELRRRQGVRFAKEAAIQQAEANRKQEAEKAKSRRSSTAATPKEVELAIRIRQEKTPS
jgi:hypothetical protein